MCSRQAVYPSQQRGLWGYTTVSKSLVIDPDIAQFSGKSQRPKLSEVLKIFLKIHQVRDACGIFDSKSLQATIPCWEGKVISTGRADHSLNVYVCFLSYKIATSLSRIPPNMSLVWRDWFFFSFTTAFEIGHTRLFKTPFYKPGDTLLSQERCTDSRFF